MRGEEGRSFLFDVSLFPGSLPKPRRRERERRGEGVNGPGVWATTHTVTSAVCHIV